MPNVPISMFKGYASPRSPFEISPEFLVRAKNVLVKNGQIRKRKPFTEIEDVPVTAGTYPYLWSEFINYDSDVYVLFLKAITNKLALWDKATDSVTEITPPSTKIFASNVIKSTMRDRDQDMLLFEGDGSAVKVRPSGQCYSLGLPEALISSAVKVGASGWALGAYTYEYVVTWLRQESDGSFTESNGSYATKQAIAIGPSTGASVTITRSGSYPADEGITHWNVYRRIQSVGGYYYRVNSSQISILTATFSDTGIAGSIQFPCPTTHDQPVDDLAFSCEYSGRAWACPENGEYLYFSQLNNFDYWPGDNFFKLGEKTDPFVKLVPFRTFLLVVKRFSMWIIEGTNIINFRRYQISHTGSNSYKSIVALENSIIYANDSGVWNWDFTNEPVKISMLIEEDYDAYLRDNTIVCAWEPTEKQVWIVAEDDSNIFVYDPMLGGFAGKFLCPVGGIHHFMDFQLPNSQRELGIMGVSDPYAINLYNSEEIGTTETEFDIEWYLGGNWSSSQTTEKSFRLFKLFEAGSGDTETTALRGQKQTLGSFSGTAIKTLTLNSQVYTLLNLGLAGYAYCFGMFTTDSQVDADWIIGGVEVEVEKLGFW